MRGLFGAVFGLECFPARGSHGTQPVGVGTKKKRPLGFGAQKKPPERLCPRGAKDISLFRERLDATQPSCGRHRSIGCLDECVECIRSVPPSIRAGDKRSVVRRSRDCSPFPMRTHPRGSFGLYCRAPRRRSPEATHCLAREGARIWNLPFWVKADFSIFFRGLFQEAPFRVRCVQ